MTFHPDMPEEYRNQIVTGDARLLAESIPDESIDLIFTDPVYDRIEDYQWLAETAARVLKPSGAVLVRSFNSMLGSVLDAMRPTLTYRYALHWQRYGPIYHGVDRLICVITHCLWLDRDGGSRMFAPIADWTDAPQGGLRDNQHIWSKPLPLVVKWLGAFTQEQATIYDPFTGGGTVPAVCKMLGRNYIASEIDPDTAERARERVLMTQPPLFVSTEEQSQLELIA